MIGDGRKKGRTHSVNDVAFMALKKSISVTLYLLGIVKDGVNSSHHKT